MDINYETELVSSEDFQTVAPSDLDLMLECSSDGQQMSESMPYAQHSSQNGRPPLAAVENPAAGSSGYSVTPDSQFEMLQNSLHTHIDGANMSVDLGLLSGEGQSSFFGSNEENLASFNNRAGFEPLTIKGQSTAPVDSFMKDPTAMQAWSYGAVSAPTSHMSRPNQPEPLKIRSHRRAKISQKSSLLLGRNPKHQRISPIRLLKHLGHAFQSNDMLSNDFKRHAMVYLDRLNATIRHETYHGSLAARKFLTGEDDGIDTSSFFGSSENSSPSLTHPMSTPVFSPSFNIFSEDGNDSSGLKLATEEPSIQLAASTSKTIYFCTFQECVQQFKTRADWTRHEKTKQHWIQDQYMCPKCAITEISPENSICAFCSQPLSTIEDAKNHCLNCHEARSSGKTFPRKDKFGQHLRAAHRIPRIPEDMESWIFDVDGDWPRQCGFCGKGFKDWEERASHIEDHFKAGKTMADYKHLYPRKDNDDDDFGGGGGGWGDQSQGGMLPPQGFNSCWPGNSSASGGVAPSRNGSSSMNNDMQYFRPSSVATASTELIPYKAHTASTRMNLVSEISSMSKGNNRYHSHTSTKAFDELLPVINTHLLLISALSLLPSQTLNHHQHNPKLTKQLLSLFPLPRYPHHDIAPLHKPGSLHQIISSLLVRDSYVITAALALSVVGSSSRLAIILSNHGRKYQLQLQHHHQHQRHRRQKSWEWRKKLRDGSAAPTAVATLQRDFERVLVLGGELGGVRL